MGRHPARRCLYHIRQRQGQRRILPPENAVVARSQGRGDGDRPETGFTSATVALSYRIGPGKWRYRFSPLCVVLAQWRLLGNHREHCRQEFDSCDPCDEGGRVKSRSAKASARLIVFLRFIIERSIISIRSRVWGGPGPVPVVVPKILEFGRLHMAVKTSHVDAAGKPLLRVKIARRLGGHVTHVKGSVLMKGSVLTFYEGVGSHFLHFFHPNCFSLPATNMFTLRYTKFGRLMNFS